jgi:hypothetical protein
MSVYVRMGSRGDAETRRVLSSPGLTFINTVIARSEATKQSRVVQTCPGLPRFAHNDDSYRLRPIQKTLCAFASPREPLFGYYMQERTQ